MGVAVTKAGASRAKIAERIFFCVDGLDDRQYWVIGTWEDAVKLLDVLLEMPMWKRSPLVAEQAVFITISLA